MASLRLSFWIGLRYMRSREKQGFLSLLSWFSLLGMAVGVAALIIVLSVMNGFQGEMRSRLLDLVAHGQVSLANQQAIENSQLLQQQLEKETAILATAPFIGAEVMLSHQNSLRAAYLQGVDVEQEQQISAIAERMVMGRFEFLQQVNYGIVLGDVLARALRLQVGDKVTVSLPKLMITPFGIKPRVKQFTVVGVFEIGSELDGNHGYIHINDAQRLYGMGNSVQALRYLSQDIMQAEHTAKQLQQTLGPNYQVDSWQRENMQLFAAIQMEKRMTGFMLALVVLVAACNLVSLLSMMVASKRNEVAVLRMMGLSQAAVLMVFLTQGLGLSLLGIIIGCGLGLLISSYLSEVVHAIEQQWQLYIFDPDVFYVSGLPTEILASDLYLIIAVSIVLSIVFSIYPAYQASKIQPVEALQYQ